MRVVVVARGAYKPRGGAERAAWNFYRHVGKHVETLVITDQDTSGNQLPRTGISQVPIGYLSNLVWFSTKLGRITRKVKPDLIQIHSYTGFIALPQIQAPTVVTFHDEPATPPWDNVSVGLAPLLTASLHRSEQFFRKLLLRKKPWVHAVSSTVKAQFEALGVSSERIAVIPSGFHSAEVHPPSMTREELLKELGIPESAVLVTSLGSISFRKGAHRILSAAMKMRTNDSDVHFVLVGSTRLILERAYVTSLNKIITSNRLHNIHLLGQVSSNLLHNIMCHTNLFISASLSEACNQALMEAASYGIPIICTDVGSARDLFRSEATILDRNVSSETLARVISESLALDKKSYTCTKEWTWSRVTDEIIAFYERILSEH